MHPPQKCRAILTDVGGCQRFHGVSPAEALYRQELSEVEKTRIGSLAEEYVRHASKLAGS
ncbi:MAG TPA: hypothetical protein VN493_29475 [Thermoanaerobaculia bacterium]|nr:hypothetical protein [Thermoanaerobaculia bacterium]